MATMTSSRCRRATVVLLLAVAVVSCRRRDVDDAARSVTLDQLLEPRTAALVSATRRHRDGHLLADDKRTWRDNRVRVWGKRASFRHGDDDDDADDEKRSWHQNTVRVWGKRQGASTADRRSWAGNTIRVWGKRLDFGLTPEQVLDVAADRYSAAPKRSDRSSKASTLTDAAHGLPVDSDVDAGALADDALITTRSKRSPGYYHHGGRWVVRRSAGHRPHSWVAFRGPKRSWRTNVIRVWGKRAA